MNTDLDFLIDKNIRFAVRTAVLIYNKDKTKVLLEKRKTKRYYTIIGGRIKFNENSLEAIKREVKEELGCNLQFEFCSIFEISEQIDNKCFKLFCFVYKSVLDNEIDNMNCLDDNDITFQWFDTNEINNVDICPSKIKNVILGDENSIHFTEEINEVSDN